MRQGGRPEGGGDANHEGRAEYPEELARGIGVGGSAFRLFHHGGGFSDKCDQGAAKAIS